MSLSVPKQLFDTLQSAFQTEARRLCRDAARVLKRPEKEVLQIVQAMPKLKIQVLDDTDIPTQCQILLEQEGLFSRCRSPCLLGTGRCLVHQETKEPPTVPDDAIQLTRLILPSDSGVEMNLWVHEDTKLVYTKRGFIIGVLTEDRDVILYETTESDTI